MTGERIRSGFARTTKRARWAEYQRLLSLAQDRGYVVTSLERWLEGWHMAERRVLLLRHDVDQNPRAVRPMLETETSLGVQGTWYFRWRTAEPRTIERVRTAGCPVGLHYETLTRLAMERDVPTAGVATVVEEARMILRREILAFEVLFGPIESICPHGDSRRPGVDNRSLLEGREPSDFGVRFDGNRVMHRLGLAAWLTDRSPTAGGWRGGESPAARIERDESPLLCVVHPHHWAGGGSFALDRVLGKVHAGRGSSPSRFPRTGRDSPPLVTT